MRAHNEKIEIIYFCFNVSFLMDSYCKCQEGGQWFTG
jgi:hypothetical protein